VPARPTRRRQLGLQAALQGGERLHPGGARARLARALVDVGEQIREDRDPLLGARHAQDEDQDPVHHARVDPGDPDRLKRAGPLEDVPDVRHEVGQPQLHPLGGEAPVQIPERLHHRGIRLRGERQVQQHDHGRRLRIQGRREDPVAHVGDVAEEQHLVRADDQEARDGRLRLAAQVHRLHASARPAKERQASLARAPDEDGQ
jgi:hypothetical protein